MKADLHIHTLYSHDAVITLEEIEKQALAKGLDCIAITDHEEIRGALKAEKNIEKVKVIPGVEFYTERGHLLALNIRSYPKNRGGMSFQELVEFIHREGGLAIAPHPLDKRRGGVGLDDILKILDALEVANSHDPKNKLHYIVLMKTAEELDLGISAGSDSHIAETIGTSYVYDDSENIEQLLENIRKRQVRVRLQTVKKSQRVKKLFLEALHKARLYRRV